MIEVVPSMKQMPARTEARILITKLLLKVDHCFLMSETQVPVGFFKFINDNVFQFGMRISEPFKSCFKAPICWFKRNQPHSKYRVLDKLVKLIYIPVWRNLMQSLGKVLMIMCLPIPLYIRLAIYY